MDNELFELCKEVYERTGWMLGFEGIVKGDYVPAYTSDYLLEKLPGRIHKNGYSLDLRLSKADDEYNFAYMDRHFGFHYMGISDTPLKALLKLTIALDEAGELTDLVRSKGGQR